jgi:hypothetical protein
LLPDELIENAIINETNIIITGTIMPIFCELDRGVGVDGCVIFCEPC